jgi:hypothetical protein
LLIAFSVLFWGKSLEGGEIGEIAAHLTSLKAERAVSLKEIKVWNSHAYKREGMEG